MGFRHQLSSIALAPVLLAGAMACHHPDDPQDSAGAAVVDAATPPVVVPTDRLGTGELVEGSEKLFALPLPRGIHKVLAIDKTADAVGPGKQLDVTAFFQARITGGKLLRGAHASDFKEVHVPSEPTRILDIHVEQARGEVNTDIEVVDVTPRKPVVMSASEAYKANGMTPDGKLADPQHMQ